MCGGFRLYAMALKIGSDVLYSHCFVTIRSPTVIMLWRIIFVSGIKESKMADLDQSFYITYIPSGLEQNGVISSDIAAAISTHRSL